MSQSPDLAPPTESATTQIPSSAPIARPGWATAIGIISILYASLGGLFRLFSLGGTLLYKFIPLEVLPPLFRRILEDSPPWVWLYEAIVNGSLLVLAVAMLVGGILLLRCRRAARSLHLLGASAVLVTVAVNVGVAMVISEDLLDHSGAVFGLASVGVVRAAYPMFVLVWFLRKKIWDEVDSWVQNRQPSPDASHALPDRPLEVSAGRPASLDFPQDRGSVPAIIGFQCPRCAREVSVPEHHAGQQVTCSACNKAIRIPLGKEGTPTDEELAAFVGSNANYYLEKWTPVLAGNARYAGFSWAAFVLCGLWLPYRKLYGPALFFFAALLLASVVGDVLVAVRLVSETVSELSTWPVALVGWVLCGVLANRWYLAKARRVIERVRFLGLDSEAHLAAIARRGGTSVLASLGLFALCLGLLVGSSVAVRAVGVATRTMTFDGGRLMYVEVSEHEARRLGEYLARTGFFDGTPKLVMLTKSLSE